jgi:hypothetical protein
MLFVFLRNLIHKTLDLEFLSLLFFNFLFVLIDVVVLLPVPVSNLILSLAALFSIDLSQMFFCGNFM